MSKKIFETTSEEQLNNKWGSGQTVISYEELKQLLKVVKTYDPKNEDYFIIHNNKDVRGAGEQHTYRFSLEVKHVNKETLKDLISNGVYKEFKK